jgi:hypothetical protein
MYMYFNQAAITYLVYIYICLSVLACLLFLLVKF